MHCTSTDRNGNEVGLGRQEVAEDRRTVQNPHRTNVTVLGINFTPDDELTFISNTPFQSLLGIYITKPKRKLPLLCQNHLTLLKNWTLLHIK